MKKLRSAFPIAAASLLLAFSANIGIRIYHDLRPGDYDEKEGAYFACDIDGPAGLIKAKPSITPTDNKYSTQKTRSLGASLIGDIESVWDSYTGKGTKIAIIDDGFDTNHPDFIRKDGTSAILSESRYYYLSGSQVFYKGYDYIGEDWEEDGSGSGTYEWATHGTNTASTAAAAMNNGGGVGIAPEADILALKIDFTFASIRAAIQYAIEEKVDVINMSLGAYGESFTDGFGTYQTAASGASTYLNAVCKSAHDNGIIVVAAAGNEATYRKSYPACNSNVIGVGAIGDYGHKGNASALAEFTNYVGEGQTGEVNVDILAPGYVYTATQGGSEDSVSHTYSDTQGTSFSCPIVAGAACLWKQKYPSGTPDEFLEQLQASADGIGYYQDKYIPVSEWYSSLTDPGPSNIQNGRLNVFALMDIDNPYVSAKTTSMNMAIGETRQIELESYNGAISYSSEDASVATVTSTGLVAGEGQGDTNIVITASKNGEYATAKVPVTIFESVACESMEFSPSSITLSVNDTYEAEPTLVLSPEGASRIFLFESEDEEVAKVDEETGLITALSPGSTRVNAVSIYGKADASLDVTVETSGQILSWDKVTSASEITSGDYLIVYEEGGVAFDGALTSLDGANNAIPVSISGGKISATAATLAGKFTLNAMAGGFSICSSSGKYISGTSGSNALNAGDAALANAISISGGNADIVSNTSHLRYNSGSSEKRFRYYKSGSYSSQKAIQLYKGSSSGGYLTPIVSGVSLSQTTLALDIYSNPTSTLAASVSGSNSPSQAVTWASGNEGVATVSSSGLVTAISTGNATITATSAVDSSKSASCLVTVTDSTPKALSSISIAGYATSFEVGDSFSFGGAVIAHYSDGSTADVTSFATFSGYDLSLAGTQTVTVSYTYSGVTEITTYTINVYNPGEGPKNFSGSYDYSAQGSTWTLTNAASENGYWLCPSSGTTSIATIPGIFSAKNIDSDVAITIDCATYGSGSNPTEATFKIFNSSSCLTQVSASSSGALPTSSSYVNAVYTVSKENAQGAFLDDLAILITKPGKQIRLRSLSVEFSYTPGAAKTLSSISASYAGGSVYVGDDLDASKVSVTAIFTDPGKYPNETLAPSDYSLSNFSSESAGKKTVLVTYTGDYETATSPLTASFEVEVIEDGVVSVSIALAKYYHPGERIAKADITLTRTHLSGKTSTTTEFEFAEDGYRFTYSDAPSGGGNATKEFSLAYKGKNYSFSAVVSRIAYVAVNPSGVTLTSSIVFAGIGGSDADKKTGTFAVSGITYSYCDAYYYAGASSLSFGSGEDQTGYLCNTTPFSTGIVNVEVSLKSGSKGVNIRYSADGTNWVLKESADTESGDYRYFKIDCVGISGTAYSNIASISISRKTLDSPNNVANYIMFEDSEGQCAVKLEVAIARLNSMSEADKSVFFTSDDYVYSTARERLEAWAAHEGKTLQFADNSFVLAGLKANIGLQKGIDENLFPSLAISISAAGLAMMIFGLARKRKENQ